MAADTRRRILDAALELFNERGFASVGVREIARSLDMSHGNLAYHFPTKDALAEALVTEYFESQGGPPKSAAAAGLVGLYAAGLAGMRRHVRYRFLVLDYVGVIESSPKLSKLERDREQRRPALFAAALAPHVEAGWLDGRLLSGRRERLGEATTLVSRSWMVSARLSAVKRTDEQAMLHYAKVSMSLLEPVCTPRGEMELRRILRGERDGEALSLWVEGGIDPPRPERRGEQPARTRSVE